MKKTVFLLFFLGIGVFTVNAQSGLDLEKLEQHMLESMEKWNIPGMAVAIIKDGNIIYEKGFGVRTLGENQKVDEHTLFAVASNTKAFTSASLARLVDQGRISWDDRVKEYLPYFQLYDPYVTEHMTIRDLLCHRAGLKTFSGDLLWYGTGYDTEEIIRRARYLEPEYEFRSGYGYSNIMFAAAGEVLEAVTDTTWDEFITHHFFKPLGMERTNTSIKKLDDMNNVARPHDEMDGTFQTLPYLSWDNMAPAAAVNSSVHEMALWLNMQLNGGRMDGHQFFSEKEQWEMWSPQTVLDMSKQGAKIWKGRQFRAYGLGWQLEDYRGLKLVSHGGGSDGMISKACLVPDENLGFVILTNSINYLPSALMYQIIDNYMQVDESRNWSAFYLNYFKSRKQSEKHREEKLENTRKTESKPLLDLKAYTGTYSGKLYGDAEVRIENEQLVVDFLPAPKLIGDLKFHHFNVFTIKLRKRPLPMGTVQFILDKHADVAEMKIDIPNPDFHFDELVFKKEM